MSDTIATLQKLIRDFLSRDIEVLNKSSILGDGYSFDEERAKFEFIQATLKNIDLGSLRFIETANAQAMSQSLGRLYDLTNQVENLNIQSGDVPKISQEIEKQFASSFQEFQRAIRQFLFLYSKYNTYSENLLAHVLNAEK